MQTTLSKYVKAMRKQHRLTQIELSEKSGVGLRFVRELEQGKPTLRLDKVNRDKVLFSFFDGLIPEGWLLDIAEKSWKIDTRDRMSLLLACCKDCIGAVSVVPIESKEE